jgi:uncharacterized protein YdeI (YjbR/CyaY-like superfamily)
MAPKPTFFPTPAEFREWLEAHHDKLGEQFVGFHKKDSGKPSITWPESVEVALCFGWIDGVRKSIDETSYMIRFTPRKQTSTWSSINVKLVGELTKKGLMHPAGLRAFAARRAEKSGIYAYEQRKQAQFTAKLKKTISRKQGCLGILPCPSGLVPKGVYLVGHQRKAGGDKAQEAFVAHRTFGTPADNTAAYASEKKVTSSFTM